MISKSNKNKQKLQFDKKFKRAKNDYEKLMKQIKPFIKKSGIVINSTEGKWYDTTANSENIDSNNYIYQ